MIETSVAYISLIEDDIIRVEYKPDCYVDLNELEENLVAYKKLMTAGKAYFLTIANPGSSSSVEVRNEFSTPWRSSFKHSEAFVISTLAQKIIANFIIRMKPPQHPLRFFTREKDALSWIYMQRVKHQLTEKE